VKNSEEEEEEYQFGVSTISRLTLYRSILASLSALVIMKTPENENKNYFVKVYEYTVE